MYNFIKKNFSTKIVTLQCCLQTIGAENESWLTCNHWSFQCLQNLPKSYFNQTALTQQFPYKQKPNFVIIIKNRGTDVELYDVKFHLFFFFYQHALQ